MVPLPLVALRIKEKCVVNSAVLLTALCRVAVRATALPNNLRSKIPGSNNSIEKHPQVMTRRRIAMQIKASRRFEDAMEFDEPWRHHREIGHHR